MTLSDSTQMSDISPGIEQSAVVAATAEQARASDPHASVFVSANAGTGKTKLLTDRVLRLLLEGTVADSILCVTYTRAAAAEMRNRIADRLADWAIIPTQDLQKDMMSMGIVQPSQNMIRRARRLFAEILDNDNGPRVETVHSFCQSILRRFPIEAGIAPNAMLADDAEQAQLKLLARDIVLRSDDMRTNQAIATLSAQTSEEIVDDVLNEFLRNAPDLGDPTLSSRLQRHFESELNVGDAGDVAAALDSIIADIDEEGLRAVAAALQDSGVAKHVARGASLASWLALDAKQRVIRMELLTDALFTDGQPYKERSLSNKDIRAALPDVLVIQQNLQAQLVPWLGQLAAQRCRALTEAMYHYGVAFYRQYHALKMVRGLLDYDDLIILTNNLLERSDAAHWVSWKLDNGIRHLLIDEAQDTSPAQWGLLRRLSDEFFDDEEKTEGPELRRTIFAVGDFKQSIYSFQGADPAVMKENREALAARAKARAVPFRSLSLSVSFRSSKPILELVNRAIPDQPGIQDFSSHRLARHLAGGFVEIWPVIEGDEETGAGVDGFAPPPIATTTGASAKAARHLARTIKSWIGKRQMGTGKKMRAGDVLVLLAKRDRFFEQVLAALQGEAVPVAGADRMQLAEQIEIQDLLALGDVMLLPEDDLQLACLLKSPLLGVDEDTLYALGHDRGEASLFSRLMAHVGGNSDLGRVADKVGAWRSMTDRMSVFAFYNQILLAGGRQAFKARLGAAVNESLDHFLTLAQKAGHMSLTEFINMVRGASGEVKRDLDSGQADEVRVMTIHGAKGLEAPIVFLPDMLVSRSKYSPLVSSSNSDFIYFMPGGGMRTPFLENARELASAAKHEERNRLLYVALTRPRDALVIGGWKSAARSEKDSHYHFLVAALRDLPDTVELDDGVLRLERDATGTEEHKSDKSTPEYLPPEEQDTSWLFHPAPPDPVAGRPLRPSEPGTDALPRSISQTYEGRTVALQRGVLTHRLFECLPALPPSERRAAAEQIFQLDGVDDQDMADDVFKDVIAVLEMPALACLFADDALAEVPITGVVNDVGVAGQIDRLWVGSTHVLIADFKTGSRPEGPPPEAYVRQMALYGALLEQIHPDKQVTCWLIWTETATIQEITGDQRSRALVRVGSDLQKS